MSLVFSIITTLMWVIVLKAIAPAFGVIDKPGGHKLHKGPVPLVGGLAIFGGLLITFLVIFKGGDSGMFLWNNTWAAFWVSAGFLVVVGMADDRNGLRVSVRILTQVIATLLMVLWAGVELFSLGHMFFADDLVLGYLAIPVTVFGVVGGINAMNMVDGIDGLAGTLALVTVAALICLVAIGGGDNRFLVALAGALMAFLLFNFPIPGRKQAVVFMGDAGSMLLGFVLAWMMTILSQGNSKVMYPVTALWIFAVPLYDAVGNMLRRVYAGKSPFGADREHIHHLLLEKGLTVVQTVMCITGAALMFAGIGIAGYLYRVPEYFMFYAFLAIFAVYVVSIEYLWKTIKYNKIRAQAHTTPGENLAKAQ
ncbi:MAG: hypothetical protein OEY67_09580 [Gammaproteobacteria bacterium]|nr:hypothetical protein [Gammaproteobacteria bacterium]